MRQPSDDLLKYSSAIPVEERMAVVVEGTGHLPIHVYGREVGFRNEFGLPGKRRGELASFVLVPSSGQQ
jgi:hypothetical protein